MIFFELFYTFFLIGAFTIGGGYAMLSLIQNQVVTVHGWISEATFTDVVAISQMTPGPIGINCATYLGYSTLEATGASQFICFLGSVTATTAVVLPSFLIVLAMVKAYDKLKDNNIFKGTMKGLRPSVIGLIGAAALVLMFSMRLNGGVSFSIVEENFPDWKSWCIFAAAFLGAWKFKIHPIRIIIYCALIGIIVY